MIERNTNNNKNLNNTENEQDTAEEDAEKPSEDEISMKIMHLYPLGFNKCEKDIRDEEEAARNNPEEEKVARKKNVDTPKKKKKPITKEENENEEEGGGEEEENKEKDENDRSCVYNVWVHDCLRSKKDFIECKQIDLSILEKQETFEKELAKLGFYNSIADYEDFLKCSKCSSTRILHGVETKFDIDIDVSDSFFCLTGAQLRAYSFQGPNRNIVFSAFSYFKSSWTQEMSINSVTNYDTLFQPDSWYYNVIQADFVRRKKVDTNEEKKSNENNEPNEISPKEEAEIVEEKNESNQNFLNLNENFSQCNNNPLLDSENSELCESITVNYKEKIKLSKNVKFFNLCLKYLPKLPKINFKKFLFSSPIFFINKSPQTCNEIFEKNMKLINKNNNTVLETSSMVTSENYTDNYKMVNYLLDSFNNPIPFWIKRNNFNNCDEFTNLKMINKSFENMKNELKCL